ncbi:hypothetical protein JCM10296v2_007773 [Rhodotorula toruloides]
MSFLLDYATSSSLFSPDAAPDILYSSIDHSPADSPQLQSPARTPQEPRGRAGAALTDAVLAQLDEQEPWRRAMRKLERFAAQSAHNA